MSFNSPFSSFSFFFVFLFLLPEKKCLRHQTEACSNVHSIFLTIGEKEHLQFFWIHTTFHYLRFVKGIQFELYLFLMGFQFSDFLYFYGWANFSCSWLNSASCSNAGFVQTKDSPSNFSNACQPLWREDSVDQSFDFSSSTTSLNHATRLTLISFVSTD